MSKALYDAVKSGKVKLEDLNDDGKKALRNYMEKNTVVGIQDKKNRPTQATIENEQYMMDINDGWKAEKEAEQKAAVQKATSAPLDVMQTPLMKSVQQYAEDHPKQELPGRNLPVVGPLLRGLDYIADNPISNAVAEYTMPDAPFLGQPGTNVRDTFLKEARRQPSTGVSKYIGMGAAPFFVPGAQLGTGNQVENATSMALTKLPKIGNVGRSAITGATTGGLTAAGAEFAQGQGNVKDAAIQGAWGAGLGGAFGAAVPLVGAGIKRGTEAIKKAYNNALDELPTSGFMGLKTKIGQKTRIPDNPESINDLIDVGGRPQGPDKGGLWSRFYTGMVDEQAPLSRATREIGGKNVPFEQDPSKIAWLSRGWKGKADTKLQYGFMDDLGNKIGQSLKEALEPAKNRLNDLRQYAVALRSLEYEKAGLKSGVSPELAQKTIAKFANDTDVHASYEGLRQYMSNMNKNTLVDSGIWSKETLESYAKEQPNYIPMFRVEEKGIRDGIQQASGKGFGNVKDPTKARTGSVKPIVDPIESIVKQTYKNQALAERNNVMRSLVELAEKKPNNPLVQKVESPKEIMEQIKNNLDDFINTPIGDVDKQLGNILDLFKPQIVNGKPNVFTVMRNGKAEQWQIMDDQLAKMVAVLGNEPSNPLINMVGKATGILKAGLVLAPDFVAKNLVRDQMSAFINSKYGFIPIWDTASGLFSAIKKDSSFWKWMNSGGANGSWVSLERDYLQGQIRDITQKNIKKMGNPVELMRKLSELSEQATRLGEFKRGLKKGASLKESALASRDVTLDFSRIGSKTKSANKAIAFFNVAIQSVDKLARQFKERPVATPIKTAVAVTAPSVLLYLLNSKRPEYNELPQWERDTNWHVYIPGQKEPLRIPKPFELGITAGTFFERLLRRMKDNDPQAFDDYAKQVIEGFTPSIIPTLLTPWIEAYANKDMFTKAPIVPKREENLLPKDQYGPYTSSIAKKAGETLKTSPRVIENTITGYTGTLGRYGLQAADSLYNKATGSKTPEKPDPGLAGVPVLRSFISKGLEGSAQSVDDFYKEKDRLTRERTSAKRIEGKPYAEEAKYDRYNKIGEQISERQGKIRSIQADMSMTPKEKRAKIESLNLEIINLSRNAKGQQSISR